MRLSRFISKVSNGKLEKGVSNLIRQHIEQCEGKVIEIQIKMHRKKMSGKQFNYFWGVVFPAIREIYSEKGYGTEELRKDSLYEALKIMGGVTELVPGMDGEMIEIPGSLTDLDSKEGTDFIEFCRRLAAEHGVLIPDPTLNY